ncbi:MAG TPA: SCO family protein [Verrucomicrobiota bacterium]|nr:SCO family protein [Verrucomicrobiota bacterium]HNT14860.1 SCO family protein [Verrucomicrobiota bacterium]
MKSLLGLSLVVSLMFLTGCERSDKTRAPASPTEQVFDVRGVVRSVPEGGHTLVVRHEAIPDYMPAMTMELNVRHTNELTGLHRDDEITFQLVATADTHWIQNIKRTGQSTAPAVVTNAPAGYQLVKELEPGDTIPDYGFVAEDGRTVHFSDFRGRAVAFTFIFTRCPLPDFCPRMGNNFAAARELLLTNAPAITNWQFISISFDPEHDHPEVLQNYAKFYRHENADRWLFATAPRDVLNKFGPELDLMVVPEEGGSISHNLRTVVLDTQGRIQEQFNGNQWTVEELVAAVKKAATAN